VPSSSIKCFYRLFRLCRKKAPVEEKSEEEQFREEKAQLERDEEEFIERCRSLWLRGAFRIQSQVNKLK
jgi:hypothetical protein